MNPARPSTSGNLSMSGGSGNFECLICLEFLDSMATVDPMAGVSGSGNAAAAGQQQAAVLVAGGPRPVTPPLPRTAAEKRLDTALNKIDRFEVCAPTCGHMFHRYCLQKWFNQQGVKTCPSCRKSCGKLTRLYPNVGQPRPSRQSTLGQEKVGGESDNNFRLGLVGAKVAVAGGSGSGAVASVSGGGAVGGNGATRPTDCPNPLCAVRGRIHDTLVSDYQELRDLFITRSTELQAVSDDLQIKTAEVASLQDVNENLTRELTDLKGAVAANEVPKRRRKQ